MTDEKWRNDTPCLFRDDSPPSGVLVSATQMGSFLACRRRWEYGYLDGLRGRREREYLTVGKLCHAGMEAAMRERWRIEHEGLAAPSGHLARRGMDAVRKMWDDYMAATDFLDEELPGQRDLLARAMDVFDEALEEFDPMRWLPITVTKDGEPTPALELHFAVPCAWYWVHGYVDAVLEDRETGQAWCVDYKFRRTLAADDDERFSLQNWVYAMACRRMGLHVAGTLTWQHRSAPSPVPRVNLDGTVSRSRVACTWERYRRFVESVGQDPADYAEMEGKLAGVETFRATYEVRGDEAVDLVWRQVVEPTVIDIAYEVERRELGIEYRLTPSLDPWNCRMCHFRDLCQAELRGYDAEFVRRTQYVEKERRK